MSLFAPEDAVEIIKHPAVERCMKHLAGDVEKPWCETPPRRLFNGRPIAPFLMLRKLVEKAVGLALIQSDRRELPRLLILLKMTDAHDSPAERAAAVGEAAESYAVRMLYGTTGLDQYRSQTQEQVP